MPEEKIYISSEEYAALVEAKVQRDAVVIAFQNYDRYDTVKLFECILRVDSFERLEERKKKIKEALNNG